MGVGIITEYLNRKTIKTQSKRKRNLWKVYPLEVTFGDRALPAQSKRTHTTRFLRPERRAARERPVTFAGSTSWELQHTYEQNYVQEIGKPVDEAVAAAQPPPLLGVICSYVFSNFCSNFWIIFGKLWEAGSRLYRSQILQVNTRWNKLSFRKEDWEKGHGKLSPRSTQCTPLHRSSISKFQQFLTKKLRLENGAKECIV